MEFKDMCKYIYDEREALDDVINKILLAKCGKTMRPRTPPVDPQKCGEQGKIFTSEGA